MPLFDYKCRACGNAWEEIVRNSATLHPACPECAVWETDRLISVPARAIFKGAGFHCNDYPPRQDNIRAKYGDKKNHGPQGPQ